jgi:hypothetical protein
MAIRCWLQDSRDRLFPTGNAPGTHGAGLLGCRGASLSLQVAVENLDPTRPVRARVTLSADRGMSARVRRIGYVPVPHHNTETPLRERDCRGRIPGYVPDPLFDEDTAIVAPGETAAFWITIVVARSCEPGEKTLVCGVESDGMADDTLAARVVVRDAVVPVRRGFPVTHWLYSDALMDSYGLDGFDARYWGLLERYVDNLVAHRQDTLYVPVFTPPLDGVKRPTQLLGVARSASGWSFDWSLVRKYVETARRCGIESLEWTHLFSQWGATHAIRVYEGRGERERLLWKPETPALSPVYRRFLAAYLPALKRFLDREGIRERSYFHLSDEPGGEEALAKYRAARGLVRAIAPWMPTMDALSEIVYGREGITDMPVASITEVPRFAREGIPCWGYYCCGPRGRYLNRLLDTPLAKVRMSGWLFHRFSTRGFLHWGANYWYRRATRTLIDPYTESSGEAWPAWAYGDPFVLYPGPDGPRDSIRWEIFAESLDDLALLRGSGMRADDPLLAPIRGFDRFPWSHAWLDEARARLFDVYEKR